MIPLFMLFAFASARHRQIRRIGRSFDKVARGSTPIRFTRRGELYTHSPEVRLLPETFFKGILAYITGRHAVRVRSGLVLTPRDSCDGSLFRTGDSR